MESAELIRILKNGGIGVLATDTLYGLVGCALLPEPVARIYCVRKRTNNKPLILLIGSIADLEIFGISPESSEVKIAKKYWPGKVSVILPCDNKKFEYLHRGAKSLAFRLPDAPELLEILKETGPLVAPSANPEGKPPALTIEESKKYFGDEIDFYKDSGKTESEPSVLLKIEGDKVFVLRSGKIFDINL